MSDFVLDPNDGFKKSKADSLVEERISNHCKKYNIDALGAIKLFSVLARRQSLKRFLSHHELFKNTLDIPGDIAEIGVYRGAGLMTWANLLEIYCIGDRTKVVFGFDNWKGFNHISLHDGAENVFSGKTSGGFSPEKFLDELESVISIFDSDRFIPFKPRVKLICGDVEDSIPKFISDNPGVRFSLVHFDCDLYLPTKIALEAIWERISRGGIVIFDEYSIHDWPGESKAVDEFLYARKDIRLQKFKWSNVPGAYLVKS